MITLIAKAPSARLKYVADTIFKQWLNLDYRLIDPAESTDSETCIISYGDHSIESDIRIFSHGLLYEKGLPEKLPEVSESGSLPKLFFAPTRENYDCDFDIFSAVFFCLTRIEEYLVDQRDEHERFRAIDSIFYGFHQMPYLDRWVLELEKLIRRKLPNQNKAKSIKWLSTMDMDIAFAYKGRGIARVLGATGKDLIKGKLQRLKERKAVFSRAAKDPFDTYQLFLRIGEADEKRIFVPTGDRSQYDINLSVQNATVKRQLRDLKSKAQIGLHPSYQSRGNGEKLREEKERLENAIEQKITDSRQHFLRIQLPDTFRSLAALNLTHDYSMGYHDEVGFRAGTAFSFRFYDITAEEVLSLELVPLTVMDSALKNYLNLTPEEAIGVIGSILNEMKLTGGIFTSVWHNHSLSETDDWMGWRQVLLATAELVQTHR
jgi:hypothetical protein